MGRMACVPMAHCGAGERMDLGSLVTARLTAKVHLRRWVVRATGPVSQRGEVTPAASVPMAAFGAGAITRRVSLAMARRGVLTP